MPRVRRRYASVTGFENDAVARRLAVLEALESRLLLSGAAAAASNDVFSTLEDKPLAIHPGVTSLFMNSQSGDYIGGGVTRNLSPADGTFSASRIGANRGVDVSFQGSTNFSNYWNLEFVAPAGQTLSPGQYLNATRYPFQAADVPGLSITGQHRGCNTLTGKFTILQANFAPDGKVLNFAADFEQHCEGGNPALIGTVKYNHVTPGYKSGILNNDSDAEGDTLTAVLASGPQHGTLALSADGSLTYTPEANFNGVDSFSYVANDGSSDSNVATVTINVMAVNDVPSFSAGPNQTVAEDAGPQVIEDWATAISAGPANESSQGLTFTLTTNNPGLFEVAPAIDPLTGRLTYTPKANTHGTATVTVSLKDDAGTANSGVDASASKSFTVTVTPVDDRPSAADDSFETYQGQTLTLVRPADSTFVRFQSSPGDWVGQGQTNTWTAVSAGRNYDNGVTFYAGGYSMDFVAPYNQLVVPGTYLGATRFPFQAEQNPGLSVSGNGRGCNNLTGFFTVRQAVYNPANPSAAPLRFAADFQQHCDGGPALVGTVEYNYRKQVGVLVNDADPDSNVDDMTAVLISGPAHGSLTLNADGTLSYTPESGFTGTDSFQYKVVSGGQESPPATVTLNVTRPAAPVARANGPYSVAEGSSVALSSAGTTSPPNTIVSYEWDLDYDGVNFTPDVSAANATFSAAGLDGPSLRTVALRVTDIVGQTSIATALVNVTNVAPVVTLGGAPMATAGQSYSLSLSASDPGSDTITSWLIDWGDGQSQTYSGAAPVATHTYAQGGNYIISVRPTDEDGASGPFTRQLTVAAPLPTLAADGTLRVVGTNAADTIDLALAFAGSSELRVTINGVLTTFNMPSVKRLIVTSLGGNDILTVNPAFPDTLGARDFDLGAGNDTITFAPIAITGGAFAVSGGDGDDQMTASLIGGGTFAFTGGGGSDTFRLNATSAQDAILLRPLEVSTGAPSATYSSLETLSVFAGAGNDVFDIRMAGGNAADVPPVIQLDGETGDDAFALVSGPNSTAPNRSLLMLGNAGNDNLAVTRAAYGRFEGGANSDIMAFSGTSTLDVINVTDQFVSDAAGQVNYATIETLNVFGLGGNDRLNITSTAASVATTVAGDDGDDTLALGADQAATRLLATPNLRLDGDAGQDSILIFDRGAPVTTYTLTASTFARSTATGNVALADHESVALHAGAGNDVFAVTPSATTAHMVHAAAGTDTLNLNLAGALDQRQTMTGPDAGQFTFSNRQPVAFTGIDSFADVLPPVITLARFVRTSAPHELHLFFSEPVYRSIQLGDLTVRDADTSQPIDLTDYFYDVGANIAVFSFGRALPDGRYRLTIPRANISDPGLLTLPEDFVFDFSHLAGDADSDGRITADDYFRIDLARATDLRGFVNGDFNYSGGSPDADDYMIIDRAFFAQGIAGVAGAPLAAQTPTPAPEPSAADTLLDDSDELLA